MAAGASVIHCLLTRWLIKLWTKAPKWTSVAGGKVQRSCKLPNGWFARACVCARLYLFGLIVFPAVFTPSAVTGAVNSPPHCSKFNFVCETFTRGLLRRSIYLRCGTMTQAHLAVITCAPVVAGLFARPSISRRCHRSTREIWFHSDIPSPAVSSAPLAKWIQKPLVANANRRQHGITNIEAKKIGITKIYHGFEYFIFCFVDLKPRGWVFYLNDSLVLIRLIKIKALGLTLK